MGMMQRDKGKTFERLLAKKLREAFPGCEFRRSRQSDGAYHSDVYCNIGPWCLRDIWWECTHGHKPNPAAKMKQAVGDIEAIGEQERYIPVVVWRRTGQRVINATLCLDQLMLIDSNQQTDFAPLVTLELPVFIEMLQAWVARNGSRLA